MNRLYALLVPALLCTYTASAQDPISLNMTLFDQINPVRTDSVGPNSALWGYVGPEDREYAILGSQLGAHIIDITEKPIREVTFIPGPKSTWREMKVYQHYAYIITESSEPGKGLQIVDLSELPTRAVLVRTDSAIFNRAHTVFVNGHYLYVMGTQAEAGANGGAIIYDLEPDPLHPVRVGAVAPYYFHDAWERNDTLLGAAIYGQGCDIWDVRDRANPKHLATISYPYSGTHNAEITSDGGYVVTSDEIGYTPKTMKVWDIHDLENVRLVAEYTPNPLDVVHNVHVRGRYVLAAWYTGGVRVIDMIDPLHPREVAFYDTYPGQSGGYNGAWESYGIFPSGKVIVSDRQTGLYVVQFNGATAGSLSGVVRNRTNGNPIPGVTLHVAETKAAVVTDAQGHFYVGGPIGATRSLSTQPFGFSAGGTSVTLNGDMTQDIQLDPLEFFPATLVARDREGGSIADFAYAVEPYQHSTPSNGTVGPLQLPRDSVFMVTVAKWGYGVEQVPVRLTQSGQEVSVTLRKHYQDNATLNLGWSFESPEDSATSGRWTRLVPYLGYAGSDWIHPPTDATGQPGGFAFETGAPPINAPANLTDVNGGFTTLTTPPMDLRGYTSPKVGFDLWFVHYKADSLTDSLRVQISSDGGASWTTLYAETEGRAGWKPHMLDVPETLTLTDRMLVRFRASDSASRQFVMVAVDNFEVTGGGEPATVQTVSAGGGLAVSARPNPMASRGELVLHLNQAGANVRVEIFNALGVMVASLHHGALGAGDHRFTVPDGLAAGAYTVRAAGGTGAWATTGFVLVR